jgi:hypothetical protein
MDSICEHDLNKGIGIIDHWGNTYENRAQYRRHLYDMGIRHESMDVWQIKGTYPSTIHRPVNSHRADIYVPELNTEIESKLRTYAYTVTNAHIWAVINKNWLPDTIHIWLVDGPIELTQEQVQMLRAAKIRVFNDAQALLAFLKKLKAAEDKGIPSVITAKDSTDGDPENLLITLQPIIGTESHIQSTEYNPAAGYEDGQTADSQYGSDVRYTLTGNLALDLEYVQTHKELLFIV